MEQCQVTDKQMVEESKKKSNNIWKYVAIIFIILFILETCFIVYAYKIGNKYENNRIVCSNNVCFNSGADSFLYDDTTQICYCYLNNEVYKQEYLP